jgi:hypothetical protein
MRALSGELRGAESFEQDKTGFKVVKDKWQEMLVENKMGSLGFGGAFRGLALRFGERRRWAFLQRDRWWAIVGQNGLPRGFWCPNP